MLGKRRLRYYFVTGVAVTAPTAISFWLLYRAFTWVDQLLGGAVSRLVISGYRIPGVGFAAVILIILLVGYLTSGYVGGRILSLWERVLSAIPLLNRIYPAIKQIGAALLTEHRSMFRHAVLIEYPRRGIYSLGFTTKAPPETIQQHVDSPLVAVFMPTTPNPTSGVFLMVPRSELVTLDLSVEDAIKLIISGGMVPPQVPGQQPATLAFPARRFAAEGAGGEEDDDRPGADHVPGRAPAGEARRDGGGRRRGGRRRRRSTDGGSQTAGKPNRQRSR